MFILIVFSGYHVIWDLEVLLIFINDFRFFFMGGLVFLGLIIV